jgi:8-oxo-dGTP diphosphatase
MSINEERDLVAFTADVVVWRVAEDEEIGAEVLLIRRAKPPYKGALALPGGHVEATETSAEAAVREAAEETGLDLDPERLRWVGLFDRPDRDPRGRVVAAAWTIQADPGAGDDAAAAEWIPLSEAVDLAFDHDQILRRATAVMLAQQTADTARRAARRKLQQA